MKTGQSLHSPSPAGQLLFALLKTILSLLVVLLTLPFSLCWVIKVTEEHERAVIFRLGRIKSGGSQSPGLHFILPCIDKLTAIDLRTQVFDVVPQEVSFFIQITIIINSVRFSPRTA